MAEHKRDMNITKIEKKQKLNINMTEKLGTAFTMEHKTDMKNTKKLNGTSMTKHKADMNITKIEIYKN